MDHPRQKINPEKDQNDTKKKREKRIITHSLLA